MPAPCWIDEQHFDLTLCNTDEASDDTPVITYARQLYRRKLITHKWLEEENIGFRHKMVRSTNGPFPYLDYSREIFRLNWRNISLKLHTLLTAATHCRPRLYFL